jgi:protein-tyrosine phosphatase
MFDIHCHVLPAIDDGAKDMGDSLAICRKAVAEGVLAIAATPHFIEGESEVLPETIQSRLDYLHTELNKAGIDLTVHPGMEIYMSPNLAELYEQGKVIAINNKNYMLIEMPIFGTIPPYADEVIFSLQMKRLKPLIAHPERYRAVREHPNIVYRFIEKGCAIQVNSGSIMGQFGKEVQKTASKLLEHNLVHAISSDNHSCRNRIASLRECYEYVAKKYGGRKADNLFINNCRAIIQGQDLYMDTPSPIKRNKFWLF